MRTRFSLAVVVALGACGPGSRDHGNDPVDAPIVDPTVDAPPATDMSLVYAHTSNVLYRLDATSLQAVQIGTITGLKTQSGASMPESLTDLAIDKDNHMIGVSLKTLYSIDPATGAATVIAALPTVASGATSLSFVPAANPSDPDILVTANDQGDVYQINTTNGQATKIGNYGTTAGGKVVSSGDLIGVRGLGPTNIYATVNVGTEAHDFLATIDPSNGWKATPIGSLGTGTGFDNIFGLGFWGGKIYGFTDSLTAGGKIVQLDATTGAGTMLKTGSERWYGAGVGTNAPIIQ